MKVHRKSLAGLSVAALVGGLLVPVIAAPSAQAAPAITTADGFVSPAAALTFTNRTVANSGLGDNSVLGVYAVGSTVYAATLGGLSISNNGGATFTNRTTGLGSPTVRGVYAVGSTVYAATSGGLSISTDSGATFTNRTTGLGSATVFGVYAVGSTVYAATSGGLSISTDGGTSFTNRTDTNSGLGDNSVRGVYAVGSTVYAATTSGLSISTNGGTSFSNYTTGLVNNFMRGVYAVGSTVYAATESSTTGGLSRTANGGTSFTNYTTANGLGNNSVNGVYAVGTTVYAATQGGGLSISTNLDDSPAFTNYTTANGLGSNSVNGVYVDGGTVYAATNGGLSISLPALTASPASASVVAGTTSTVTISTTARPLLDDSAVTAVSATPGVATVTSTASPSGGSGNAVFTVTGVTAGTSNVTFSAAGYTNVVVPVTVTATPPPPPPPPAPDPVFPPSGPTEAKAEAGDGSATVTWGSPASQGSFPVSNYQVQTTPSSSGCLVPAGATSCILAGLRNGTTYAVQVRALNGAGWGAWADAGSVTPTSKARASIVITGSRSEAGRIVVVEGRTTGLVAQTVQAWVRLSDEMTFREGTVRVVDAEGAFAWQRATSKQISVYFATTEGSVRSSTLTVAAR